MTRIDATYAEKWDPLESGIPALPGSYILILHNAADQSVQIGRLGQFELRIGYYCYVGSALGSGGLRGRLRHHLQTASRPRWQIDYLRRVTAPEQIWFIESEVRKEHLWVALLREVAGMRCPIPRFGASDCSCEAHLLYSSHTPSVEAFRAYIHRQMPADSAVRCCKVTLSSLSGKGVGVNRDRLKQRAEEL